MKIVIPDDYQDAVRTLDCFASLTGHEVTIYNDSTQDVKKLAERFQDSDALVLIRERTAITEDLLSQLPKLKFISQTGRGMPHIDLDACNRHGIPVAAGGGSPYSTAELTWGLILATLRHIPQEVANLKAGRWQSTLGLGLHGRVLGIFGYGNIGKLVANYGRAFGMQVIVWGREGSLSRAQADGFAVANSQQQLFEQADVLSIHVKLLPETRGIVTASDLQRMKPDALFVNTSRALLVAPDALEEALHTGHPGYAAVDVYEVEPLTTSPLLQMDNVVCTPHLGYVEKGSYEVYFKEAFDNLLAFAAGNPLNIVNPQALA
ncbi:glyoxylate reductase [Dictyobacter alpinus]|uniref:Glyoxylate reductase n=1 Tax=Dictyobacter alpinus TaxID=2014873 RepID=A0A402BKM5_9CHLR|nr:D-2-hydroxyacid dehydrogenase family protein [Dictyobacter alpinus]GCE31870.1 glyoxylate reductase [Dictyobacter alpinus]